MPAAPSAQHELSLGKIRSLSSGAEEIVGGGINRRFGSSSSVLVPVPRCYILTPASPHPHLMLTLLALLESPSSPTSHPLLQSPCYRALQICQVYLMESFPLQQSV
ncbi:hypothetical protein RJ035_002779, partial [Blastomyces gilchristii]